jgi:hypothetical protein
MTPRPRARSPRRVHPARARPVGLLSALGEAGQAGCAAVSREQPALPRSPREGSEDPPPVRRQRRRGIDLEPGGAGSRGERRLPRDGGIHARRSRFGTNQVDRADASGVAGGQPTGSWHRYAPAEAPISSRRSTSARTVAGCRCSSPPPRSPARTRGWRPSPSWSTCGSERRLRKRSCAPGKSSHGSRAFQRWASWPPRSRTRSTSRSPPWPCMQAPACSGSCRTRPTSRKRETPCDPILPKSRLKPKWSRRSTACGSARGGRARKLEEAEETRPKLSAGRLARAVALEGDVRRFMQAASARRVIQLAT